MKKRLKDKKDAGVSDDLSWRITAGIYSAMFTAQSYILYKLRESTIEINKLGYQLEEPHQTLREIATDLNEIADEINAISVSLGQEPTATKNWVPEVYNYEPISTLPETLSIIAFAYLATEFGCQAVFKKSPTMSLVNKVKDAYKNHKIRKLEAEAN